MRELQLLAIGTFFSLIVGGGLFLLFEGGNIPGFGSQYSPAFRTLDKSSFGPTDVLVQRKNYIFRDEDDYLAFWELLYGNDPGSKRPPLVSFSREHVIAVVGGVQSTGGYGIEITDIVDSIEDRTINITMSVPGSDCISTSVLSNPYHVVVVKKTDKILKAVEVKEEYSCEN